MLTCHACLRRWIRALNSTERAASLPRIYRNVAFAPRIGHQKRSFRATISTKSSIHELDTPLDEVPRNIQKDERRRGDAWNKSPEATSRKWKERKALVRSTNRQATGTRTKAVTKLSQSPKTGGERKLGRRDPAVPIEQWRHRKHELQYLHDPLELAGFVKQQLRKGKDTEALQLVRMASHSLSCVVSWNHLIDYYLSKDKSAQAVKVYNDMKKRAQVPDAFTYTILLNGLAKNTKNTGALAQALTIYHSLYAPNSPVRPSVIHTNAMLKVCSRVNDMDALWGVVGKIPEKGPRAANGITYAIILGAIRQSLLVGIPVGESEESQAKRIDEGVLSGRRIWEDIINRWRSADLIIEEELVCAMGRLLLIGARPRDWDDVLSLVDQTMDIPRLVPRLGTKERNELGLPLLRTPHVLEAYRFDDNHLSPSNSPRRGDEFLPARQPLEGAMSKSYSFARPGNNTLSMIMEACLKIVAKNAAREYWEMLTETTAFGVEPDINNLHQRLRIMRQNRASGDAVELLRDEIIAKGHPARPGTFRIAMSTCVRDKNNHNSLRNANAILDLMFKALEDVDPKTVTMYANLAISFPLAKSDDIKDSFHRLVHISDNIRIQLTIGASQGDVEASARLLRGAERDDAHESLKRIYALMDRAILEGYIPEDEKRPYKDQRAKLSAFLNRYQWKFLGGRKAALKAEAEAEAEVDEGKEDVDHAEKKIEKKSRFNESIDRAQDKVPVTKYKRRWLESGFSFLNDSRGHA